MTTEIHRLLDEAFSGIEMTPDAQDLKEEIRANLLSRVAELEASGIDPADAARSAIDELGDVRALLGGPEDTTPRLRSNAEDNSRYRVRPKPGFVVRAVVWSVGAIVGLGLAALGATGILPLAAGPLIGLLGIAATGLGLLVGDSLSQETTTNHPVPERRAGGYALATFAGVYGLGVVGLVALQALPVWAVVFAALGIIGSIILFAFLGATQTNRHKSWVRDLHRAHYAQNRFEQEPETAARFGIYTAAIWLLTFGVIVALVFTVGWWWALLAFVGGLVAMLLLLATMMFGPRKTS